MISSIVALQHQTRKSFVAQRTEQQSGRAVVGRDAIEAAIGPAELGAESVRAAALPVDEEERIVNAKQVARRKQLIAERLLHDFANRAPVPPPPAPPDAACRVGYHAVAPLDHAWNEHVDTEQLCDDRASLITDETSTSRPKGLR
jgi:hypothetical protein